MKKFFKNIAFIKNTEKSTSTKNELLYIALVGNPNSGKTTLFNSLTGERRYVGNWAGVTVEKRSGVPKGEEGILITDLPGLYSLYPYTPEEEISKNFILSEECGVVLNVVDGVNIERNLYLTLQLIESGKPVVVAVNMSDILEKRGIILDYGGLERELGTPFIPVSASRGTGLKRLLDEAKNQAEKGENLRKFAAENQMKIGGNFKFYTDENQGKDEKNLGKFADKKQIKIGENSRLYADKNRTEIEKGSKFYAAENREKNGKNPRLYTADFERIIERAERLFREKNFDFPRHGAVKFFDTGEGFFGSKTELENVEKGYKKDYSAWEKTAAGNVEKRGREGFSDLKTELESAEKGYKKDYSTWEKAAAERAEKVNEKELFELKKAAEEYAKKAGQPIDMLAANQKYLFITGLLARTRSGGGEKRSGALRKLDAVLTHKIFAVPIFFLIMFAVFTLAFGPPGQALKGAFGYLYDKFVVGGGGLLLEKIGVSPLLLGLLRDGILKGVGSVLSFLPEIALLFAALSILEDSGYMARAAFISDRIFRRFGLSGKSFIPMLMGFGCNAPAIIATRTLENQKQRRVTMAVIPFMSCGARLPVYAVFATAFFPDSVPLVVFSLYFLGIAVAALSAVILKKVIKGESGDFLMELPEYRIPSLKNMSVNTLERLKDFVFRAGTLIAVSCAAVWFLQNFTPELRPTADAGESLLSYIGRIFTFIFRPLGFDDWRAATALLIGLTAKEAVLGTLEVLFNLSGNPSALSAVFSPASAYSFMVFTLLYTPCVAALSALKREMKSGAYFAAVVVYQLVAAWLAAFIIYRISLLF
jgi:ferrous iron transport protein B